GGRMVTSQSFLKKLINEAEASPQDSARQPEKAKSKPQIPCENGVLQRQELQQYVEKVFRTVEKVLECVPHEEAIQRTREIGGVHLKMEVVLIRLEQSIGRLEALIEAFPVDEISCSDRHFAAARPSASVN